MNIIFLDIDGVVRIEFDESDGWQFCPQRIDELKRFCLEHDFKIVMSSDWRYSNTFFSRIDLDPLTKPLEGLFHKDWRTTIYKDVGGIVSENCLRWVEVQKWLDEHDVERYLILEDFPELFQGCPEEMELRIILCEDSKGLSKENFSQMKNLLI